jgi:ribosomal protein S27AE
MEDKCGADRSGPWSARGKSLQVQALLPSYRRRLPNSAGKTRKRKVLLMAESLKQERQTKKTEGSLDPNKQGNETAASDLKEEVGGRSVLIFVTCPHCGSSRVISFDYEGEWFTCGQCQGTYQVVS